MYKFGISFKVCMVFVNKVDLLGGVEGQENVDVVLEVWEKFRMLEVFVEWEMVVVVQDIEGNVVGRYKFDVVFIFVKYSMNLWKVVGLM